MPFFEYVRQALQSPMLLISTCLTLGVILVNGWTDAPNAIATCVCTRAIGARRAIRMAAVFNFLGVLVMTRLNASVAITVSRMADFGGDARLSLIALCAAMVAIVLWAVAAWYFGIPTSESHALLAGISGAAVAINGNFSCISGGEWKKVLLGLGFSTLCGFGAGYLTAAAVARLCTRKDRRSCDRFFSSGQVVGGAAMAFMHGAQDGQKFMAIFLLGAAFTAGDASAEVFTVPVWLMLLCSAVMALGTSIGGYRIIKAVGMNMVKLRPYQGFSADLAAALCLLASSLAGMPVSTTHTKTTAVFGVGSARRVRSVHWGAAKDLILTWIYTFPGCGLLGFFTAKLFLAVFNTR